MRRLITPRGYHLLQEKIKKLEEKKLIVAEKLNLARLDGDISENADFLVLQGQMMEILDQMSECQSLLDNSEIREKSSNQTIVELGNVVFYQIAEEEFQVEITDQIVADPSKKKISFTSPLATRLLGKKVGDSFQFQQKKIQIIGIK